mmetsp:Transcript_176796/g.430086  ORF Transcript_176796/g.430086 Transcript_176796/m.430086 type:complete len:388 (-) Transcript_176796:68-1231(-)
MTAFTSLRWLLCLCVHLQTSSGMFFAREEEDAVTRRNHSSPSYQDLTHPDRSKGLETMEINLDLPPRQRFKFLAKKYRNWYRGLIDKRIEAIKQFDPAFLDEIVANLNLEDEYREEIEGFLEEINDPRCTLRLSLIGQMKYELGFSQDFACTGIVAAMENGTVVHGRNMDVAKSPFRYGEGMFNAVFKRNGQPLYESPFSVGIFGVGTALRYGGWSIEQNTRSTRARSQEAWNEEVLAAAKMGGKAFPFVVRSIIERVPDFDTAVREFANAKFMAPHYWILAGAKPFEGAVVTTGRVGLPTDVRLLKNEPNDWFLIQTNDDHWQPPADPRRNSARTTMTLQGRHRVQHSSVWESMRSAPVCNPSTWWTWQAIPALNATSFTQQSCKR